MGFSCCFEWVLHKYHGHWEKCILNLSDSVYNKKLLCLITYLSEAQDHLVPFTLVNKQPELAIGFFKAHA